MTSAAYFAICRPIGSVVIRVVDETIFFGSPRQGTCATKSTTDCGMPTGTAGNGTRLSVTATT